MGRRAAGRLPLAAFAALALALAPATADAAVRAGVAEVDASWHVGASAGQYASDGTFVSDHGVDPNTHSVRRQPSYGRQSELKVRAIVVEGPDGERIAVVKNDLYLPGDLLHRRTAQLLEAAGTSGVDRETLTMAVTHNHSSPYYSSPSFGVWTFQDVFDVRFFDYYAKKQAEAVERAAASLRPVRVGASVNQFDKTHRHSFGPQIADDGSPAGYPQSDTDHDMIVVRFDDISDPGNPKPLANLVNFPLHPEFLDGNDLITADYLGPMERMADRETGAMTILTQGSVGTAEPERSTYHSIHERLEFSHKEYAQAEYAARLMADSIVDASRDVARGTPGDPGRFVPFQTDFPVAMEDKWYPGPFSHPYPGVSSCRTDKTFAGDPQVPVVGLPDCAGAGRAFDEVGITPPAEIPENPLYGANPGLNADAFQRLGIPVPENYSAPSYGALEEDLNIHLQAFRLGDILFTVCSCEQWKDQGTNIKTRTDRVQGNQYNGFDWSERCTANPDGTHGDGPEGYGDGTWNCADPRDPDALLEGIEDRFIQKMRAQVNNPANGWNDLANAASAESEPPDVRQIKGNFTHDDDARSAQLGYRLTVAIGMANDYNGYIASYREYQRGDHYRKALTAWGPHSADYLATRLVTMGRRLADPSHPLPLDQRQEQSLDARIAADNAFNDRRAEAFGQTGEQLIAAYEARLPDDGGVAEPVVQPPDLERFGVALFTWNGGSNFTDSPSVRVQRKLEGDRRAAGRAGCLPHCGRWIAHGDGSGEVPITLKFPQGPDVPSYESGSFRWEWTAHFEPFVARFDLGDRARATPPGAYRFVVDGLRREGGRAVPYSITSREFAVAPWSGITVEDVRREPSGRVSFRVGPRSVHEVEGDGEQLPDLRDEIGPIDYPDSYESPARFIDSERTVLRDPDAPADPTELEWFCLHCSWRPWADEGDANEVLLTVVRGASARTVRARPAGDRWVSGAPIARGESAYVGAGCVRDPYGNFNGAPSTVVGRAVASTVRCVTKAAEPGVPVRDEGSVGGGPGAGRNDGRRGARSARRCLPRKVGVSAGRIGPARLGASMRSLSRRYRVARRGRSATRFCVRGGGRFLVAGRRGRVVFAATTARRHHTRQTSPGRRARRGRPIGPRTVRRGLLLGHRRRGGRVIYGKRRGRIAYLAVARRREAGRTALLVRRLQRLGLR